MIITWKFPINESELIQEKLEQIGDFVKKEVGFENEEISISKNKIIAAPELGRKIWRVQTFRMALYDLVITTENRNLIFKFRFLTLYILPVFFALLFAFIANNFILCLFVFCFFSAGIIIFKWTENRIQKSNLKHEIKKLLD